MSGFAELGQLVVIGVSVAFIAGLIIAARLHKIDPDAKPMKAAESQDLGARTAEAKRAAA